jgi:hypothetical protein
MTIRWDSQHWGYTDTAGKSQGFRDKLDPLFRDFLEMGTERDFDPYGSNSFRHGGTSKAARGRLPTSINGKKGKERMWAIEG